MRVLFFLLLVIQSSFVMAQNAVNSTQVITNETNQEALPANQESTDDSLEGVDLEAIDQYDTEYLESEASSDIPDEYFLEDYSTDGQQEQPVVSQNNASTL